MTIYLTVPVFEVVSFIISMWAMIILPLTVAFTHPLNDRQGKIPDHHCCWGLEYFHNASYLWPPSSRPIALHMACRIVPNNLHYVCDFPWLVLVGSGGVGGWSKSGHVDGCAGGGDALWSGDIFNLIEVLQGNQWFPISYQLHLKEDNNEVG